MKRWMSLAETARRLNVPRRSVWEAMLMFSPLIRAAVGERGKLEFQDDTVERLAWVFSARRKGWTDPEIQDWLKKASVADSEPNGSSSSANCPTVIESPVLADPHPGTAPQSTPAGLSNVKNPSSMGHLLQLALRPILQQLEQLRAELQNLKEAPLLR